MSIAALIVAAGSGERFAGDTPKQFCRLAGEPLLRHCVAAFTRHPGVDRIDVVLNPDHERYYETALAGLDVAVVAGGATRRESVFRGLRRLTVDPPEHVLIHDGARPLVDHATIDRVLAGLTDHDAVVPALPISDSIKRVGAAGIEATIDRDGLWRAQTPQGFRFTTILAANESVARDAHHDDDASIALAAGGRVAVVNGSESNLKVTFSEDLTRAERLFYARLGDIRVGSGFDTHRLVAGDRIRLCGVDIPANAALGGHSDADVALHAITDALLGAVSEGDIGTHFPPHEPRWRDIDSQIFLSHAGDLVRRHGGLVSHIDLTLICEHPKIKPHRQVMRETVASLLSLPVARISIKATTTEKLGFLGRGEGVAAQATATVRLPFADRDEA